MANETTIKIPVEVTLKPQQANDALKSIAAEANKLNTAFTPLNATLGKSETLFGTLKGSITKTIESAKALKAAQPDKQFHLLNTELQNLTKSYQDLVDSGIEPTLADMAKFEAQTSRLISNINSLGKANANASEKTQALSKDLHEAGDSAGEVQTALLNITSGISDLRFGDFLEGFGKLSGAIQRTFGGAKDSAQKFLGKSTAASIAGGFIGAFAVVGTVASTIFSTLYDGISKKASVTFAGIKAVGSAAFHSIVDFVTGDFAAAFVKVGSLGKAFDIGKNIEILSIQLKAIDIQLADIGAKSLIIADGIENNLKNLTLGYDLQKTAVKSIGDLSKTNGDILEKQARKDLELAKEKVKASALSTDANEKLKAIEDEKKASTTLEDVKMKNLNARADITRRLLDIDQKRIETGVEFANSERQQNIEKLAFQREFTSVFENNLSNLKAENVLKIQQLQAEKLKLQDATSSLNAQETATERQKINVQILAVERAERLAILDLIEKYRTGLESIASAELQNQQRIADNDKTNLVNRIEAVKTISDIQTEINKKAIEKIQSLGGTATEAETQRLRELQNLNVQIVTETNNKILDLTIDLIDSQTELEINAINTTADYRLIRLDSDRAKLTAKTTLLLKELNAINTGATTQNVGGAAIAQPDGFKSGDANFGEIRRRVSELNFTVRLKFAADIRSLETEFKKVEAVLIANQERLSKELNKLELSPTTNKEAIDKLDKEQADNAVKLQKARSEFETAKNDSVTGLTDALGEINNAGKAARDRRIEQFQQGATGVIGILNAELEAMKAVSQGEIDLLNKGIEKQKERVQVIKDALKEGGDAARQYTADQLQLEEDRQKALEQKRNDELDKQKAYVQAQLVLNALLAVSETVLAAVKLGSVAGAVIAAINVALILTTLGAGLAAARTQAQSSALAEKGGYVEGLVSGKSHKEGGVQTWVNKHKKGLELEGSEYVFPKDLTKSWLPHFEEIRNRKLSPQQFAENFSGLKTNYGQIYTTIISTKSIESKLDTMIDLLAKDKSNPLNKAYVHDISKR